MARSSKNRGQQKTAAQKPTAQKSTVPSRSGRPGGRPIVEVRPARLSDWIGGARPLTLPLAIAPVALGFGAASLLEPTPTTHWVRALLCLVVALALQIGVNFANDYSDGVRGTDANRQGPQRLVGSGRARPKTVRNVALAFFAIAGVAGVLVVWRTNEWWLLIVGAVCIAGAWFYTGGRRPYGYAALGELAVFVFFGLVATAGTTFVLVKTVNIESWLSGVAIGCIAVAVLLANNLRDRERDKAVGKRTLSVLIGDLPSRVLYSLLMLAPFGILAFFVLFYFNAGYVYFGLLSALPAILIVLTAKTPPEFVTALKLTTFTALVYGLALGAVLAY